MTEEQKLERCISLIWDFGKIYDGDDIEQFQIKYVFTIAEHDELVKYLENLKAKAEATKELEEQLTEAKEIIRELSKYLSDSKWYSQNDQIKIQSKLVAKAEVFLKE